MEIGDEGLEIGDWRLEIDELRFKITLPQITRIPTDWFEHRSNHGSIHAALIPPPLISSP
jgi:hypothetical protein